MSDIKSLAESLVIDEARSSQLALDARRIVIDHSLVLHRDKVSAKDLKEMIAHLEAAGMPETAALKVDGTDGHTRMYARWSVEEEPTRVDTVTSPPLV